jgi:hypothetical protein
MFEIMFNLEQGWVTYSTRAQGARRNKLQGNISFFDASSYSYTKTNVTVSQDKQRHSSDGWHPFMFCYQYL